MAVCTRVGRILQRVTTVLRENTEKAEIQIRNREKVKGGKDSILSVSFAASLDVQKSIKD